MKILFKDSYLNKEFTSTWLQSFGAHFIKKGPTVPRAF